MATYGLPGSNFPTKMARDDFVGKKFSIAGQVLVRERAPRAPRSVRLRDRPRAPCACAIAP
jgi:hypothetical protein